MPLRPASRWFLIVPVLLGLAFLVLTPPISQDQAYPSFADQGTLLGIRNFWNVLAALATYSIFRWRRTAAA